MTTRKDNVSYIANTFVIRDSPKDPFVTSDEAGLRCIQVKERQAQAIQASRSRMTHAVINYQPATRSLDWRVTQTDLIGIPPGAAACFEHQLMCTPMFEISGKRDPHMSAHKSNWAVDKRPLTIDATR